MASSRDDFIIAIRSAFLKKSTQQKFSLLTLVFISIFIILLSSLDFKAVRYLKAGLSEVVYRSSFIVSIPENFVRNSFINIIEYTTFFNRYQNNRDELDKLKSDFVSNEIIQYENQELKVLIDDYISSSNKILAKIIVDHDSPFLKSIIINKGSKYDIKIGTNIYDQSYLVGRVIEVNYKTSRVLLLSDLNSNVPVTIAPQNIQAIVTGSGDNFGQIKYIKAGLSEELVDESIVYTSGTGAIFKSGVPIGKLRSKKDGSSNRYNVEFYSDFTQLKYVFAETITQIEIPQVEPEIVLIEDKSEELDRLQREDSLSFEAVQAIATGIPRKGHSVVGIGTYRDGELGWKALSREFIERKLSEEVNLYANRGGRVVEIEHMADQNPRYLKSAGGAMARLFFL